MLTKGSDINIINIDASLHKNMQNRIFACEIYLIIGKFDICRTLDKKSPHKSGYRKQMID